MFLLGMGCKYFVGEPEKDPSGDPNVTTTGTTTSSTTSSTTTSSSTTGGDDGKFKPRFEKLDPHETSAPIRKIRLACCDGDWCAWVDNFSDCTFPQRVYYCEYGQSNLDGSITCFDY